jgi:hypothetical protein
MRDESDPTKQTKSGFEVVQDALDRGGRVYRPLTVEDFMLNGSATSSSATSLPSVLRATLLHSLVSASRGRSHRQEPACVMRGRLRVTASESSADRHPPNRLRAMTATRPASEHPSASGTEPQAIPC